MNLKKNWRLTSLPLRLSLVFLVSFLLLELLLFALLYRNILNDRVSEEVYRLMARGDSYADVLADHFDNSTVVHISQIESETDTKTVILNKEHDIVRTSRSFDASMQQVLNDSRVERKTDSHVLVRDWRNQPYLVTASPVIEASGLNGKVYMFLPTEKIVEIEKNLQRKFIFITGVALLLTVGTALFLSRFVAAPINRLNVATTKLLNGTLASLIEEKRQDEIGDLARTIQQMNTELARLKLERTNFFADLAHELRTPITYICGYSEILQNEQLPDTTKKQAIEVIHNEGQHLTKLISNVFELARMDTNSFELQRKNIPLVSLYAEVIKIGRAIADTSQFSFETSKERMNDSTLVYVDFDRLLQVFRILFTNACQHSEGRTLFFRMDTDKDKDVVTFNISDDGKGIPVTERTRIFERLYRVEKSRSRETGGSGLGLAIAKQIVTHHQGEIEAVEHFPQGTTFIIRLPLNLV